METFNLISNQNDVFVLKLSGPTANTFRLNVSLIGKGRGTVTSDVDGIDCPGDCEEDFATGTAVMVTAAPDSRSTFKGWEGDCTGTDMMCTVNMDQASFYYFPWTMYFPAIQNSTQ